MKCHCRLWVGFGGQCTQIYTQSHTTCRGKKVNVHNAAFHFSLSTRKGERSGRENTGDVFWRDNQGGGVQFFASGSRMS